MQINARQRDRLEKNVLLLLPRVHFLSLGYSFGFGFIEYVRSLEDGAEACRQFNGLQLEHKRIKVDWARPQSIETRNTTLYVKGFPPSFDEEHLRELFSPCGTIVQIRMLKDKHVAFVIMSRRSEAEQALNQFDGHLFNSSDSLTVKFTDPDCRRRHMARILASPCSTPPVYVSPVVVYYPSPTIYVYGIGQRVSQDELYSLFSQFGPVVRVDIIVDFSTGLSKDYAFVTMSHYDQARQAIEQLNNVVFHGRHLQVRFKNDSHY